MKDCVERFIPNIDKGLNDEQIKIRIEHDLVNHDTTVPTKTIGEIICLNLFTLFNFLNFFLGLLIIIVGAYKNLLFLGVVICNTVISIIQEIRSKIVVDKLAVISETKTIAIRNGKKTPISNEKIVLDDILEFKTGSQVVTDSIIMDGECLVNESFITGESDPILKKKNDKILSGSFIVSGKCIVKVDCVGENNYVSIISSEAKYIKKINSEIMLSLKKVIKIISIIIVPIGLLFFYNQITLDGNTFDSAVVKTVAAMIGMIPEGLMLLTSTVLAVSVIRLSKYNVLVQELYCIETLARVDTLCLDKTGTITTGKMEFSHIIYFKDKNEVDKNLVNLIYNLNDENTTISSIKEKYKDNHNLSADKIIPFSSEKKWSGAYFKDYGSLIIGSCEFLVNDKKIISQVNELSKNNRVLVLVYSKDNFIDNNLPNNLEVQAIILIKDEIRSSAIKTFEYFNKQNVDIKILSGDNVITVSNIANSVGIKDSDKYIDVSKLDNETLENLVDNYTIFGRVSPKQKKVIINALKKNNHTVAMVGDGVNDVLALKDADCSIAIASGTDAARNVSQMVLLDSNFDSLPKIVGEGRRTINNIERSATLFLVKTIYTFLLVFIFLFINQKYPFIPIQLSLISTVTIGIPSFILALEPNYERVKKGFLLNILKKSLPTALVVVTILFLVTLLGSMFRLSEAEISTISVLSNAFIGFMLLFKICYPFNKVRITLFISLIILFLFQTIILNEIFSISRLSLLPTIILALVLMLSVTLFNIFTKIFEYFIKK